jgi:hypothetical protein
MWVVWKELYHLERIGKVFSDLLYVLFAKEHAWIEDGYRRVQVSLVGDRSFHR